MTIRDEIVVRRGAVTAARSLTALGRQVAAAEVLDPVLTAGSGCDEHPAEVLAVALLPLLGAGRGERVLACHRAGCPTVASRPALIAEHLEFLRLSGDGRLAVELARRRARRRAVPGRDGPDGSAHPAGATMTGPVGAKFARALGYSVTRSDDGVL